MNAKRILAALLASLMLVPALAACSDEGAGTPADDTTAADVTTEPAETEPRETERHEIKDDLPKDLKLGGKTINFFIATEAVYDNYVMGSDEKAGDVVNEAVRLRNNNVQEQLGFVFKASRNSETLETVGPAVSSLILAGDSTYDAFLAQQCRITGLVSQKLFYNGYDLKYVNYEQPWWLNNFMDELTLGTSYRPLLVSDFNTGTIEAIRANIFNKDLYRDLYGDPDALYQEVLDGKFTFDRMNELVAGAYKDLNGNGKTDVDDQLGLLAWALQASVDPFVYSGEIGFTTRDKDGYIQLNMISEEAVALCEKLCAFFHQPAVSSAAGKNPANFFVSGNILFMGNGTFGSCSALRDMEDDYGILPHPKMTETQETYYSLVHDTSLLTGVSIASKNLDVVGAVLEALAAESYRRVTPAYYESALKLKYARDDVSSQMIDLIKSNMTTNFIYAYNTSLNAIGHIYRTLVTKNNVEYVSMVQSKLPAAEASLAELVKTFKGE
ncbi:MAG: hypothetical protein E7662_00985 [Ruminococcaceae bacterium]|nr:hypothetical protein [Oscillospiraceae bacterium]